MIRRLPAVLTAVLVALGGVLFPGVDTAQAHPGHGSFVNADTDNSIRMRYIYAGKVYYKYQSPGTASASAYDVTHVYVPPCHRMTGYWVESGQTATITASRTASTYVLPSFNDSTWRATWYRKYC